MTIPRFVMVISVFIGLAPSSFFLEIGISARNRLPGVVRADRFRSLAWLVLRWGVHRLFLLSKYLRSGGRVLNVFHL